ncbi:MAG: hypothetical protein D6786_00175 [Gammaproteobacteria bacterium]|nr:MAG: hypothetical protein D6786_00175 [Gammaproteobacteria bacterium]
MKRSILTLIPLLLGLYSLAPGAEPLIVKLAYVGEPGTSALAGVRQGLSEANVQGRFLGQEYRLEVLPPAAAEQDLSGEGGFAAVIAALPAPALLSLARGNPDLPVFNITAREDDLRDACLPNLLHVIPSERMLRDAEAQWRRKHPDSGARAHAWDEHFRKYAASQLNKRFREDQGIPMDDEAWAGWAAARMVADLVARRQSADPEGLLAALRGRIDFDGQKGVKMNFRPNGQLSQVIFLVENGRVVGEAPVRGVAGAAGLESLGKSECPAS